MRMSLSHPIRFGMWTLRCIMVLGVARSTPGQPADIRPVLTIYTRNSAAFSPSIQREVESEVSTILQPRTFFVKTVMSQFLRST